MHLEEYVGVGKKLSLACVRREVRGMLYTDDTTFVSTSAEGPAKIKTAIVTVFEAAASRFR